MYNYFDDVPFRQAGMYNPPPQTVYPVGQQYPYVQMMPAQATTPSGIPAATPTGVPTGPTYTPPVTQLPEITTEGEAPPETLQSVAYTAGFLRTQIGRKVRVEFMLGTSGLTDRSGILIAVGASYILLREPEEDNIIMCDLYSIKFVTVYY